MLFMRRSNIVRQGGMKVSQQSKHQYMHLCTLLFEVFKMLRKNVFKVVKIQIKNHNSLIYICFGAISSSSCAVQLPLPLEIPWNALISAIPQMPDVTFFFLVAKSCTVFPSSLHYSTAFHILNTHCRLTSHLPLMTSLLAGHCNSYIKAYI